MSYQRHSQSTIRRRILQPLDYRSTNNAAAVTRELGRKRKEKPGATSHRGYQTQKASQAQEIIPVSAWKAFQKSCLAEVLEHCSNNLQQPAKSRDFSKISLFCPHRWCHANFCNLWLIKQLVKRGGCPAYELSDQDARP